MAANFWLNDAGTWRKAKALWLNDAGTWRKAKAVWFNDAGTWRKVFSGFTPTTGNTMTSSITTTSINPQLRFQTDGTVLARLSDNSTTTTSAWGAPTTTGAGSNFWIIVTLGAGSGSITGSLGGAGSPIALSSEYVLTMTAATVGNVLTRDATYAIYSDSSGSTLVGSGNLSFISDRS